MGEHLTDNLGYIWVIQTIKDKLVEDDVKMDPIAVELEPQAHPVSVQPVAKELVIDESIAFKPTAAGFLANNPLADMFVKTTSSRNSVLVALFKALPVNTAFRLYILAHGFFTMSYTTTIFFVTVIGLLVYYYMVIQAVGIVHLGPGVDAEKVILILFFFTSMILIIFT